MQQLLRRPVEMLESIADRLGIVPLPSAGYSRHERKLYLMEMFSHRPLWQIRQDSRWRTW